MNRMLPPEGYDDQRLSLGEGCLFCPVVGPLTEERVLAIMQHVGAKLAYGQIAGFATRRFVRMGLVLLGTLAVGGASSCHRSAAGEVPTSAMSQPASIRVPTQAVAAREVPMWLSLTGQLKGKQAADLAADANGKVIKTLVERGQVVKAGQPLVILDTRAAALSFEEAKASAASAMAAAENAKMNCERYRVLAKQGAISDFEFDAYTVQCRTSDLSASAARARAALAGKNLGDGIIRAPFAGAITERYVDVGQFVRSDSRVVGLVDLSSLRLEFTVPEARIAAVRLGGKVRFQVASHADKTFDGTVRYMSAQVRPGTRDLVAEAVVDSPSVELKPGMFALLKLDVGRQSLPVVPSRSIVERDGKSVVFVAAEGRLEERIVHVGDVSGEEKVILRGVATGDKLVVEPAETLKNGQNVL
jgi:membrane fusion protein, multidrug efflux system